MEAGAHIIVRGLVQGVGFRYYVSTRANRLLLRGFVTNLLNGEVEIMVEGDRSAIESLISDVKVGPRSAQVRDLTIEWTEPTYRYDRFSIH